MKRSIMWLFISFTLLALSSCSMNSTNDGYEPSLAKADPTSRSIPLEIAGTTEGIEGSPGDSSGLTIGDIENNLHSKIPHCDSIQ
ncbi:hypothetical protein [Niallia oryzisoli]|uniref:hypothetical protein n=1 Tax=Niallia oryzisoli TaxID=1737571 RepID=UPI003736B44B